MSRSPQLTAPCEAWRTHSASERASQPLRILAETLLPTRHGPLRCLVFSESVEPDREHVAMLTGDVRGEDVLLRMHTECLPSEVFGSLSCHCREHLDQALERICAEGRGLLVYRRRALALTDEVRDLGVIAALLRKLSVCSVRVVADHVSPCLALEAHGVTVRARIPLAASTGVEGKARCQS